MREESDAQRQLAIEEKLLESKERSEVARVEFGLKGELSSIKNQRETLHKQRTDQMRVLDSGVGRTISELRKEISELDQAEAGELASELKKLQEKYLSAWLSAFKIIDASIPGIGTKFKLQLMRAGVHTAADVDFRVATIPGIGPARQASVRAWQAGLIQWAQKNMPQVNPAAQDMAIRSKYGAKKRDLEARRCIADQQYDNEAARIKSPYATSLTVLDGKQESAIALANGAVDKIKEAFASQRRICGQKSEKLAEDLKRRSSEIDAGNGDIQKAILRLHWEKGKLNHTAVGLQGLSFANYAKRILRAKLVI